MKYLKKYESWYDEKPIPEIYDKCMLLKKYAKVDHEGLHIIKIPIPIHIEDQSFNNVYLIYDNRKIHIFASDDWWRDKDSKELICLGLTVDDKYQKPRIHHWSTIDLKKVLPALEEYMKNNDIIKYAEANNLGLL